MTPPANLGIDVSKDTLDVCLLHHDQTHQGRFANAPEGHQKLLRWLRKRRIRALRACLEATGFVW